MKIRPFLPILFTFLLSSSAAAIAQTDDVEVQGMRYALERGQGQKELHHSESRGGYWNARVDPDAPHTVYPYAGKVEPRIGNWFQAGDDDLRLDIGTAVELITFEGRAQSNPGVFAHGDGKYAFDGGVEFFTWTKLRAAGRFKFPVEAVDYYFGVYGSYRPIAFAAFPLSVRLRVAHISAHLVDGDPGLKADPDTAITYSREFADLLLGRYIYHDEGGFGWYLGGTWLFSTIPSSIGRVNPYAGFDYFRRLWEDFPLTLQLGYEFRLNTELETIGENQVRVGLKFADVYDNGVTLEGHYYAGRSPFGQFFDQREEHFSIGFLVDH